MALSPMANFHGRAIPPPGHAGRDATGGQEHAGDLSGRAIASARDFDGDDTLTGVEGDVDGDGLADLTIEVVTADTADAGWFAL